MSGWNDIAPARNIVAAVKRCGRFGPRRRHHGSELQEELQMARLKLQTMGRISIDPNIFLAMQVRLC